MNILVLEFSKGMILPKKDSDNPSKIINVGSKESINNVRHSDNVSFFKFFDFFK